MNTTQPDHYLGDAQHFHDNMPADYPSLENRKAFRIPMFQRVEEVRAHFSGSSAQVLMQEVGDQE